jgi:hypothetical protein
MFLLCCMRKSVFVQQASNASMPGLCSGCNPDRAASPVLLISGFLVFFLLFRVEISGDSLVYGLYLQRKKEVTVGLYKNLRGLARRTVLIRSYDVDQLLNPKGTRRRDIYAL